MTFSDAAEPHRRELLAHCYRMLGSLDDAEDAVQETFLRAFRAYEAFKGDSSLRVWLYRIATNVCLTAIEQRGRRALPSGLGAPGTDPAAAPALARDEDRFVGPIPDALVVQDDPASIVVARESLRLALVASLQHLPGRQRAVLILREVLGFPAAEVAEMLDTSVAAVKSSLQRARANLSAPPAELQPLSAAGVALLEQYMAGFQNSDLPTLERALRTDAVIEMVPSRTWFAGRETCTRFLGQVLAAPGDWRMTPTVANGQPAVVAYFRGEDGRHHAFGVAVLTVAAAGITRISVFGDPRLAAAFGLAETH